MPASDRQRQASRATRRKILDAALAVFAAKGTNAGTLSEIADAAGVTRAGVLHHFGSKEGLLQAVLEHRDDADVEGFPDHAAPQGQAWFQHLVNTAMANAQRAGIVQAYVVLSAESVTDDHFAKDYFIHRYRVLRDMSVEAFTQQWGDDDARDPIKVRHSAAGIPAVMDGLQVQWLLDPTNIDLPAATAHCIEALVRAALPTETESLTLNVSSQQQGS